MMKNRITFTAALLLAVSLMTSCGSAGRSSGSVGMSANEPAGYTDNFSRSAENGGLQMNMEAKAEAPEMVSGDSGTLVQAERKLVRTISISGKIAEGADVSAVSDKIKGKAQAAGGYTESSSISSDDSTYANITVRIPADKADAFLQELQEDSAVRVTEVNDSAEDVTSRYIDTESRLQSAEEAKKRYMDLMQKAESVSDILEIQQRLDEIIAEEESYERKVEALKNQVTYCTVNISVRGEAVIQKKSPSERFADAFDGFLGDLLETVRDAVEWFAGAVVWLIFILPILFVVVRVFVTAVTWKHRKDGTEAGKRTWPWKNNGRRPAGKTEETLREKKAQETEEESYDKE